MLKEVDDQLDSHPPDLVIAPVGVGSFAQAVVAHYKSPGKTTKVVTVEPDTAACLWKSLAKGSPDAIQTSHTIMAGMDAGTVSSIAWPFLRDGVDASVTVSDHESHLAVQELVESSAAVLAGPCGAATLAALRRLTSTPHDRQRLNLTPDATVVLLCTEGRRPYPPPRDVSLEDATSLTQALVRINSAVPGTGTVQGPGETEIAQFIAAWLEHRDMETHWIEPTPGRPSVVGIVRGTGGGKSLMFNGHIDTVTTASYSGDPLSGVIQNGKLYGRGSADMKSGLAASLVALAEAKKTPLAGDVLLAAVADEEDLSIGTEQVLEAGWRADAAVVCEPTDETLANAHRGFAWLEVDIHGVAAHGSRFDLGVDAITRAGSFLVELARYSDSLLSGTRDDPLLGPPSVHASMVRGGEEPASYPAKCTVVLERRTVVGETPESVRGEVLELLRRAAENVAGPELNYHVRVTFFRPPFAVPETEPIVQLVKRAHESVSGEAAVVKPVSYWTDCALLADKGIPAVLYGPKGHGLHSKEEWVDVKSVETVASTLVHVMKEFCGSP
ncbi:Zn-dependent exopeptidase [Sodiomyces alkalinus F11]|uniref:Probable succinyl-diaminopimelate desuccinylase n=1 Tax=Sodiomyces alkalinus (strain CBS 110278 / VKM F-3762 / F11) TaxID=1314773 RepID=A0A3N2PVR6_SODAK|nr:Zn-dependent exopeptidase [Sodiomyces alkalinus F11]ROT38578.1 Zn-dependent exopeptidase [Sodiomyces alkalinus F11]